MALIKHMRCVRWVPSKGMDPEAKLPTHGGKFRGRPANPNGGSWQVYVPTTGFGTYYSSGFASRELAGWDADIARWYLTYAGLLSPRVAVRYNFPERMEGFSISTHQHLISKPLRYFVWEANGLHFGGERDPLKPLLTL